MDKLLTYICGKIYKHSTYNCTLQLRNPNLPEVVPNYDHIFRLADAQISDAAFYPK